MGLMLGFHGGLCCGIKVIHGFGEYSWGTPTAIEQEVKQKPFQSFDQNGSHFRTTTSFFTAKAPQETKLERLDRLIAFCEKYRPNGIIEITLNTGQRNTWVKLLEERGFREVNKCRNSNSFNTVHVFHKNSGE